MKIKAFRLKQKEVSIYLSVMPAASLVKVMKYDRFGISNPDGYQRDLEWSRVEKAVRFLMKEEGTFPTSVLVNYRGDAKFSLESKLDEIEIGYLELSKDELYIVDGQHRLASLQRVVYEHPDEFNNYPIIVSIFSFNDPDRFNEMRQFYIVNSRQKKVETDLALKYLHKLYEKHGQVELVAREGTRRLFEVQAVDVVLKIKDAIPWRGRVQLIGEESKPEHIIGEGALAKSISYILKERLFVAMSVEELAEKLGDYWSAISEIFLQAFANPENYTIQKTPGANAFHMIFPSVYARSLEAGGYSKDQIKKILSKLKQPPAPIIDDDFWHTKKGNPLALGTSRKMMTMLADTLAEKLKI